MFSFNDVLLFSVCLLMHYPFAQRMRLLRLRGVPDGVVPAGFVSTVESRVPWEVWALSRDAVQGARKWKVFSGRGGGG
jgi:hypothetical protein